MCRWRRLASVSWRGTAARLPSELDAVPAFVADMFAQADAAAEGLAQVRYTAMDGQGVRASVRGLYTRVARLQAQALRRWPRSTTATTWSTRPGRVGQERCSPGTHGMTDGAAKREVSTARLLDAERGDLKTVGAALAAVRSAGTRPRSASGRTARWSAGARRDRHLGRADRAADRADRPILAGRANELSVGKLAQWASALVEELNPKTPAGAHERAGPAHVPARRRGVGGAVRVRPGAGRLIRR